jgi:transcriptional regulator with XRE-family HTH domain
MDRERLKSARELRKLTQEELAKKVNVTKGTISNYENGHSTPSNEMLRLLADTLKTTTDFLLGRPDEWINVNTAGTELKLSEDELAVFNKIKQQPLLFHKLANAPEKKIKALIRMWEALETAEEDEDEDTIED